MGIAIQAEPQAMACNKVEELYGSLTAVNILIKTITLVAHNSKNATEEFVSKIFPNLEILLNNQMTNWNEHSPEILFQVFKSFLNVVTIEIPDYLDTRKNSNSFNLWMSAIQSVLTRQLPDDLTSGLRSWKDQLEREKNIEWKLKRSPVGIKWRSSCVISNCPACRASRF